MVKDVVIRAYNYFEKKHEGQMRAFSGLPYFTHPKGVARLLEELGCDENMVAAGLGHDGLEDTDATYDEVAQVTNVEVADLILGVTSNKEDIKAFGGKRLYLAHKICHVMNERQRTLKLADRCQNVEFLDRDGTPNEFIVRYYKETRFILRALSDAGIILTCEQVELIRRLNIFLDHIQLRYKL